MGQSNFGRSLSLVLGRRRLLVMAGAAAGLVLSRSRIGKATEPQSVFSLGVASGDPLPDGVVLWTRLAPDPLNGGGMPQQQVLVQWQIASDKEMQRVIQQGTTLALPEFAHSVHVEVRGLEPAQRYWYQFRVGDELSPVGRTRTTPAPSSQVDRLRFAFASCQRYEDGYYTAYQDMVAADPDFVVYLGDYIYEGGATAGKPRPYSLPEAVSLEQYRNRYALHKRDPDLQAAHAAFPWIVTWDDHEVSNDYANLIPDGNQSRSAFLTRRANAYQAYYEHMPLRRSALPQGSNMQLYRRLTFGNLAEINVLDTRQYRSDQPCGGRMKPRCEEAIAPDRSMLGPRQEQWLFEGLRRSQARWNVLAQGIMMSQYDFDARPEDELFGTDLWDGYVASRDRLFEFLNQQQPNNPIVITGDFHSSWVHDLKLDFGDAHSPTVATEFVGTSISSSFSRDDIPRIEAALSSNPHTQFFDGVFRGYVLCTLTAQQWQTDFRAVSTILEPNGSVMTLASFVVEDGKPGAQKI